MNDLISRNALVKELDKREYSRENHDFKILVENQPIAYDLELVLKQAYEITSRISNYCEEIDLNLPQEERTGYDMLKDIRLLRDVIGKGGVEEEKLVWNERNSTEIDTMDLDR